MCGIFGIFEPRPSGVPDESKLHRTAALLRHRGPDGLGVFSEPGIGLVHTRLSLVDLSDRSNQPLWDPTDRYALVFNGELYDYGGLRSKLERLGAVFQT